MSKGRNHAATQNRRRRTVLLEEARHAIAMPDPSRGREWAPSVVETVVLLVAADRLDTAGRG